MVDAVTSVDFGTADNYQYHCEASYNPDSANLSYAQTSNFNFGNSNEDESVKILIEGHVDNRGSEAVKLSMSTLRISNVIYQLDTLI